MEQVKIFFASNDEKLLQDTVNEWLREHQDSIEITGRFQTQGGRLDTHLTITIFYRAKS